MDKRSLIFVLILSISLFFFNQWIAPPIAPPKIDLKEFSQDPAERLYVLENDTQQIVFSNLGGAIKELNLPFLNDQNTSSIVRPIEFDRTIEKESPLNAQFPLSEASFFDEKSKSIEPYNSRSGGYTPQLRRSIRSSENGYSHLVEPKFYLAQLLNETGDYDQNPFQVSKIEKDKIEFTGQVNGQKVTKTYELISPYGFKLTLSFSNAQNKPIYLTSGISEVELISGGYAPSLQALTRKGDKMGTEKIDLPSKELGVYMSMNPLWLSNSNGFFGTIINPEGVSAQSGFNVAKVDGEEVPTRLNLIDQKYDLYPIKNYPGYQITKQIIPQNGSYVYHFYAGPYEEKVLLEASEAIAQNPHFELAQSVQGWFSFISEPFAKLMFFIMKICYKFTHSWGLAILAVTIALRLLMYPLNRWSSKSMIKMAQLQPEIQAIDDRFKKDPKKAEMEKIRLYQEKKINPFTGCVPLLIQIPFLIGMFDLFKTSFDLRGVPFLIPAWIPNLAAPDVLFSWGYPLPFIGNEFHLLPFIAALVTLLQSRLTSMGQSQPMTEKQRQQVASSGFLSIITCLFFYHFAAGVNIYFAFSSLLGVLQQFIMMKKQQPPKIQILKK
ncbi:MAG: membrane protein insertase YidC [Chlamydiia bacterium]